MIDYSHPMRSTSARRGGARVLRAGETVNLSQLARQGQGEGLVGPQRGQVERLAREAYGVGMVSGDRAERAYAAGVEDLARWLTGGEVPSPQFGALLDAVRDVGMVRRDRRRS